MAKARKLHSELCRAILQVSPAAMFLYDLDSLRILAANDKARAHYGYSGQEFHSMTVRDLHPNGTALSTALLIDPDAPSHPSSPTTPLRSLSTHVTKTGEPFAVELSVIPLFRGRRRLAILFAVDAANWSGARLEAKAQNSIRSQDCEELPGWPSGALHEMEAIGRFAGGIAHDFNNITQSIGLSCELALRGALPLPVRTKLFGIMQQANRAADITQRLLAFSRHQLLQPRVVDLNECIQEALPSLSHSLGLNISMDLRLDGTLPPAYVDPEQLTLVLTHLGDNARAAMPDGGVLRIATAWEPDNGEDSEPSAHETSRRLLLTVSDSGVGMDEATRRRIYEPFFSTKKTAETAGLGLATVHGIIHQSNGRIECESAPGRGTTFRIQLPVAANAESGPPAAAARLSADAAEQRLRVLVVDEGPSADSSICELLLPAGFSVDTVDNGWEALASFVRRPYDLVVSGIATAGLGGVELTRRLRQLAPGIPVVLISGQREPGSVLEELPHNQIAYLQKPCSGSLLVAMVRNLVAVPEPT